MPLKKSRGIVVYLSHNCGYKLPAAPHAYFWIRLWKSVLKVKIKNPPKQKWCVVFLFFCRLKVPMCTWACQNTTWCVCVCVCVCVFVCDHRSNTCWLRICNQPIERRTDGVQIHTDTHTRPRGTWPSHPHLLTPQHLHWHTSAPPQLHLCHLNTHTMLGQLLLHPCRFRLLTHRDPSN